MMKAFSKALFFICLFFSVSVFSLEAEEQVYQSNSIGQILKKLKFYQLDEHDWILRVSIDQLLEHKKLFFKNELKKQWKIKYYSPGKISHIKEMEGDVVVQEFFYNISGNEIEERKYIQGELNRKILFFYDKQQGISKKENYDKDNQLLYTEYYELTSQGQIRSIEQRWGEKNFQRSSFVFGKKGIVQEIYESNHKTSVIKYDSSGSVLMMESYEDDKLIDRIEYVPTEDGNHKTIKKNPGSDNVQERVFNDKSQLLKEIQKEGSKVLSELLYYYNDDNLISKKQFKGPEGLLEEIFDYNEQGDLLKHYFYERGSLVKSVSYIDDMERVEDYFRKEEKILSVFFKDEKKIKEEIFEKGELVKERSFQ
ncbi:MAG: hypothetical protein JXR70_10055 [Spirochaetales bacterium]|nr:hypothetical protein [Spirochaetales bacterium]